MKKIFVILLVWSTAIASQASTNMSFLNDTLTLREGAQRKVQNQAIRTVVIDPGHGGRDEGCSGANVDEKKVALEIALAFGKKIESWHPEIEVIYTRETDKFVALHERARIANKAQADLFISIHCNALAGHANVHGSETYVMGLHTADHNLSVEKRENEAIRLESDVEENYSFDPNSPAGHITLSMFQYAFQEQSIAVAEHIERRLGERENRKSRGVRMAGFMVLKETAMPSVLVETGYLSNKIEEAYLSGTKGQQLTVQALYNGFADYLNARTRAERSNAPRLASQKKQVVSEEFMPVFSAPVEDASLINKVTGVTATEKSERPQVEFFVQIAAATSQIDTKSEKWRSLNSSIRFVREGAYLKYQSGPFKSKAEAELAKAEAVRKGFSGAFTVGYIGEQKLSASELQTEK